MPRSNKKKKNDHQVIPTEDATIAFLLDKVCHLFCVLIILPYSLSLGNRTYDLTCNNKWKESWD